MRKTRDMEAMLLKKGFRRDTTHHKMYWFYAGSKQTAIRTRISHGASEYDDYLLGQVRKQMKLDSKAELDEFFDCQMDYEKYLKLLTDRKKIAVPEAVEKPPAKHTVRRHGR